LIKSSIHDAGERLDLPYRFKELGSWRIAAELVRRHPEELLVIETHPGDGQYDCLSIYRRSHHSSRSGLETFLQMNRAGRGHVDAEVPSEEGRIRPNWLDIMATSDLRNDVVLPIEQSREIESPSKTPATTSRSVGVRLIAEMLQVQVHHHVAFTARNGMEDSSGMGGTGVREVLFREFGILDQLNEHEDDDVLEEPAYRFWFVKSTDSRNTPVAAIDVRNGLVWTKSLRGSDLMSMYGAQGRSMVRLAATLLSS
jgi:hypothetical protein